MDERPTQPSVPSLKPTSFERPAGVVETHISVVTFVGDRAYKLKKPVDLGFLDLTTRDERHRLCRREVDLNRRLAPDVYLGVLDVHDPAADEVLDHLVVMRRMPDDRRLATLVEDGDERVPEQLRTVARQLADFHSTADRSPDIDRAGTPAAIGALWEQSFAELVPFEGTVLDPGTCRTIERLVERYLGGRHDLFARRVADGRICDGHGDLQAADIFCLDDGPRILDCIEFADHFRHGDVVADVAFLAMDLERLGAPELVRSFLDWYAEFSGETCPRSLVAFYVAYRAHVRAKVLSFRFAQVEEAEREAVGAEARRLLHTAARWLDAGRVRLVLVGGTPGTGKSTVAQGIGDTLGWPVLATDEVRQEGIDEDAEPPAGIGEGRYRAGAKDQVYRQVLERAFVALRLGESVVVDATWLDRRHREEARAVAAECLADLVELRCEAPPDVAAERIRRRLEEGTGPSEATPEVAAHLAASADPWPEAGVVDTGGPPEDAVATALEAVLRPVRGDGEGDAGLAR